MTFPNFSGKYDSKPVFSPVDSESYRQKMGISLFKEPFDGVIICYSRQLVKYIKSAYETERLTAFYGTSIYKLDYKGKKIGIAADFGFGAPIAVSIMEQLIGAGVKKFVNLGIAGTLQKHVEIGDIVVCDKAVRDEGTSYHYVKSEKFSYPSDGITGDIKDALDLKGVSFITGGTWTTDAPYRETVAEVQHYQSEGIVTVDMEASALFALAQFRDVQIGSLFTISDSLAHLDWKPEFDSEKTMKGLETIFITSLDVLSKDK
ncbi:MAG: nucleoside phosphorylase [Dehalococcoidales bacterium]|nr:nucleoside phosphorylase [Dehalococcoidales bacterium]